MKTILHITECLGSGVLYYVRNMSAWQIKEYNVVIAYSTRPETPENFMDQFDDRVRFIKVDGFTREIEPQNDLKAFCHIRRILKEVKPDIIHLHSTKAGIIGRWAINCNRYKVFYSPHAYSFLMMDCSRSKRNLYATIERISNRKGCLTITDTEGEYRASRKVTKNSCCIPNGISIPEMDEIIRQAESLVENKDKPVVCMSGKAVMQKNPRLFNEIAESMPEYDFLWIGSGPLADLLTSPNITVTGWMTRAAAIAKIIGSDVFIFTSLWESLSIALMEVMYLGKPCVVSKCDGNKDIIEDGINGFLCDHKDEYVTRIRELVENKEKSDLIGQHAKRSIEDEHNTGVMEKRYRELFI